MNAVSEKPTLEELRTEAEQLGITEVFTGGALEELLSVARDNPDPMGYLAIHAPAGLQDDERSAEEEVADDEPIGDVPAPLPQPSQSLVSLAVPLSDASLEGCYVSTHVEVRMSHEQGLALRRLQLSLDAQGASLAGGRRVIHASDAVKWLLEQIASQTS
jgi:hypothetical protein